MNDAQDTSIFNSSVHLDQPLFPVGHFDSTDARNMDPGCADPVKCGISDDQVSAVDDLTKRQDLNDLLADAFVPEPDSADLIRRAVRLMHSLRLLPTGESTADPEWQWSRIRASFAGFGFASHPVLCAALDAGLHSHPFTPDETHSDWLKAAHAARKNSGFPLTTARVPWLKVAALFPLTAAPAGATTNKEDEEADASAWPWLTTLLAFHVARHLRRDDDSLALFDERGHLAFPCPDTRAALGTALGKHRPVVSERLGAKTSKSTRKDEAYHAPRASTDSFLRLAKLLDLHALVPLSRAPKTWLVGPQPLLAPCAVQPGLTPVSLKPDGVWEIRDDGTTASLVPLPPCAASLDYQWPTVPQDKAHSDYAARLPAKITDVHAPFTHILASFPHLHCPVSDHAAYCAMINAALIGPFAGIDDEFPPIHCCPAVPTRLGATNTGKTTLAVALGVAMAPSLPLAGQAISGGGAPARRAAEDLIYRHGTMVFDESKDGSDIPIDWGTQLSLATGGTTDGGRALQNQSRPVRLSAPLFHSSKIVQGGPDYANRALRLELNAPDSVPSASAQNYLDARNGTLSMRIGIHARVLGLRYAPLIPELIAAAAVPHPSSTGWRFIRLRVLAALLLAYEESISLPDAAARIDATAAALVERHITMASKAMDTGLAAASASDTMAFSYDHLFSDEACSDAAFAECLALGYQFPGFFLKTVAACERKGVTEHFAESFGASNIGSKRLLAMSLGDSMLRAMPMVGDIVSLSLEGRGSQGFQIERGVPYNGKPRYRIVDLQANQIKHPAVTVAPDTANPFGAV